MKTILEILKNDHEKLDNILLKLKPRQGLLLKENKVFKIFVRDRFCRSYTILEEIK